MSGILMTEWISILFNATKIQIYNEQDEHEHFPSLYSSRIFGQISIFMQWQFLNREKGMIV